MASSPEIDRKEIKVRNQILKLVTTIQNVCVLNRSWYNTEVPPQIFISILNKIRDNQHLQEASLLTLAGRGSSQSRNKSKNSNTGGQIPWGGGGWTPQLLANNTFFGVFTHE